MMSRKGENSQLPLEYIALVHSDLALLIANETYAGMKTISFFFKLLVSLHPWHVKGWEKNHAITAALFCCYCGTKDLI